MTSVWIEDLKDGYCVRWRVGKKKFREDCGPYKAYAIQYANRKREEIIAGKLGIQVKTRRTLDVLNKEYLSYCKMHKAKNTVEHFEKPALSSFVKFLGPKDLPAIAPIDVQKYMLALKLSPTTIRMRMRCVKAMFSYAVKHGYVGQNPCAGLKMPKEVKAGRVLRYDEISALFQHTPEHISKALTFLLYTGLRRGELLSLDWSMVRHSKDVWEIVLEGHRTKTGKPRVIPLHPQARLILGQPRPADSCFNLTKDMIEPAVRDAAKAAKLGKVRIHDFRHTWATRYMEATGDLFGLMHLGGWRSINSVAQYQHMTTARSEGILRLDFSEIAPSVPRLEKGTKQRNSKLH